MNRKDRFAFDEESGSYKLTADGCIARWDEPRADIDVEQGHQDFINIVYDKGAPEVTKKRSFEQFQEDHAEEFDDEWNDNHSLVKVIKNHRHEDTVAE